jgi:hypothetical protein
MDHENVDTWHNHTYENYTLIAKKLFNMESIFNNCKLIARYNRNVTPQKVKHSLLHV